jgi:hypothetical protein
MTNLEDSPPPPAVGAYWINEGDYPALAGRDEGTALGTNKGTEEMRSM